MHQLIQITIPAGLDFAELELARDADGMVSFNRAAIERVCAASGISIELIFDAPEDNASALIVAWYQAHRQRGGDPDPVAEDLIEEAYLEEASGQTTSHPPGRA